MPSLTEKMYEDMKFGGKWLGKGSKGWSSKKKKKRKKKKRK